jgi:hypothetical protein
VDGPTTQLPGQGSGQEGLAGAGRSEQQGRSPTMLEAVAETSTDRLATRERDLIREVRRVAERPGVEAEVLLVQRRSS